MTGLAGGQLMSGLRFGGAATLCVLLGSWACGGSSSTPTSSSPTSYPQTTETFSGSMSPGEIKPFHFAIVNPGSLDAAITTLNPVNSLTMGLQLGIWDATAGSCSKSVFTDAARISLVLSGTPQAAGEYCVAIYDVGNLQTATDFVLTVQHY
jgi:hypothetical protein